MLFVIIRVILEGSLLHVPVDQLLQPLEEEGGERDRPEGLRLLVTIFAWLRYIDHSRVSPDIRSVPRGYRGIVNVAEPLDKRVRGLCSAIGLN